MQPGWTVVIGLEIHVQLATASKMFCADPVAYGSAPNTLVSPVSLGLPGALPTINAAGVELAVRMGLATNCHIREATHFARKNYFYPDLPKGYQITQDQTPSCYEGYLDVLLPDGTEERIGITRIHIEEDAGKTLHDQDLYDSLIDYNRCGTGLIEIVSEPDMRSPEAAMAYVAEIRKLVRYLDISDGNMEEGNLRVDANVSVMPEGSTSFGTRAEVKNINSITNVGKAIRFEAERQIALYDAGERFAEQTRNWDAATGQTYLLREKESADDYRYFPEPDLQPVLITQERREQIRRELPRLPRERYDAYVSELGLPAHDAGLLTETRSMADFFEAVLQQVDNAKEAAKWLNGPVRGYLNEHAVALVDFPLRPMQVAELIELVQSGKVSFNIAKESLFNAFVAEPHRTAAGIAEANAWLLDVSAEEIDTKIRRILDENPDKVATYLGGKTGLLGFFTGQVMKHFQGKADPKHVNQRLQELLAERAAAE